MNGDFLFCPSRAHTYLECSLCETDRKMIRRHIYSTQILVKRCRCTWYNVRSTEIRCAIERNSKVKHEKSGGGGASSLTKLRPIGTQRDGTGKDTAIETMLNTRNVCCLTVLKIVEACACALLSGLLCFT